MPLPDALSTVRRLREAGFTPEQALALAQALDAMAGEGPGTSPAASSPPRSGSAVTLPVLRGELADTAKELRTALKEHRSAVSRTLLAWLVANVLAVGLVGALPYLRQLPELILDPVTLVLLAPAMAGLVVMVFCLTVVRFN